MMPKLHPYQQNLLDQITLGYKPGQLNLYSTGRQIGKSTYSQYVKQWHDMQEQQPKYKIISSAEVDGAPWYTISCHREVSIWIRENGVENDSWYEHIGTVHRNMFDVSAELYMMAVLKFGR
jgi:hypothetical protein